MRPFLLRVRSERQRAAPQPPAGPCAAGGSQQTPTPQRFLPSWCCLGAGPRLAPSFQGPLGSRHRRLPRAAQGGRETRELFKEPQHTWGKEKGEGRVSPMRFFGNVAGSRGGLCVRCCRWETPSSPQLPQLPQLRAALAPVLARCVDPCQGVNKEIALLLRPASAPASTAGTGKALLESATGRSPSVPWSCLCFTAGAAASPCGAERWEGVEESLLAAGTGKNKQKKGITPRFVEAVLWGVLQVMLPSQHPPRGV